MNPSIKNVGRSVIAIVLAAAMLVWGVVIFLAGFQTLNARASIAAGLAACAVVFAAAGAVMSACALWVFISRGRRRAAFWIGGIATALSGAVLLAGVLANVIPCAGPA